MHMEIANCNNIDKASLDLEKGKLNIKFAPNGTGKSTIAKAIINSTDHEKLKELMPFKLRKNNPTGLIPTVQINEPITDILCFNEAYVSQFTFQSDELLANSFEILIRNDAYIRTEQEIEDAVREIRDLFTDNVELENLITNLTELGSAFKLSKGGLAKNSTGMKGLSGGNKIQNIPVGLEPFRLFIQSQKNVNWIDWQTKGQKEFSELSDCCPFCSSDIVTKKEQIEKVGKEYNKAVIQNLVSIINMIGKLGDYLSDDTNKKLEAITTLADGIEKEHEAFLMNIKTQIDTLLDKLTILRDINGFDFKQGEKVDDKLSNYKLDLEFFATLNAKKTCDAISSINASIEEVIKRSNVLQGKIGQQRSEMKRLIEKHQIDINNFLSYAGYKYAVEISGEDDHSQLKLRHVDYDGFVSKGDQYLSFGERNAFAIVLFMYECLAKKPNLIILDDPISSFDKNKKYAILEMLFHRKTKECLKGETVLMLTHDVEPIIDTIKAVAEQFNNMVSACYLKNTNGSVTEKKIRKSDIKTFSQICSDFMKKEKDIILRLIYLRRNYEILDDMGDAYQVLSNLFHLRNLNDTQDKRKKPLNGNYPLMDNNDFNSGCENIKKELVVNDFDYEKILERLKSKGNLKSIYNSCTSGYEKLQIFRLFGIDDFENSVIKKFINETYHIENEFISQLDPSEFDLIPEYVVKECDKYVAELK